MTLFAFTFSTYDPFRTSTGFFGQILQGLLRPGDIAVDVGAHVGTHTVALSLAVGPTGTVHAFEAQPALVEALQINTQSVSNVVLHTNVVGDADGESVAVRLFDVRRVVPMFSGRHDTAMGGPSNNFGALSLIGCAARNASFSSSMPLPLSSVPSVVAECAPWEGEDVVIGELPSHFLESLPGEQVVAGEIGGSAEIPTHAWVDKITLDSFGWTGSLCPRLIKIDVEGMESSVLLGAAATIRACMPILHVENNMEESSESVMSSLADLGCVHCQCFRNRVVGD